MPNIETILRYQKAVYWEATDDKDRFGQPLVNYPVEIKVRWEDKLGEVIDSQGNTVGFDTVIIVDFTLVVGSVVWLGTLKDYELLTEPTPPENYRNIIRTTYVPDIRNRHKRQRGFCIKRSDALPGLA